MVNLNLIMDYPIIGSNPIFSDGILLIVNEKKRGIKSTLNIKCSYISGYSPVAYTV